jgi:hypothetical protein
MVPVESGGAPIIMLYICNVVPGRPDYPAVPITRPSRSPCLSLNFKIDYHNKHHFIQLDIAIFTWNFPVTNFPIPTTPRRSSLHWLICLSRQFTLYMGI